MKLGGLNWIVDEMKRQTLCIFSWSVCCERSRWCTGHMNEMSIQHYHPHLSHIYISCDVSHSHSCHPFRASTLLPCASHGDTPTEPFLNLGWLHWHSLGHHPPHSPRRHAPAKQSIDSIPHVLAAASHGFPSQSGRGAASVDRFPKEAWMETPHNALTLAPLMQQMQSLAPRASVDARSRSKVNFVQPSRGSLLFFPLSLCHVHGRNAEWTAMIGLHYWLARLLMV